MRIHPLAVDALTALVPATVACLLGAEAATQGWPPLDASAWTLVALINLPLVVRGRAPVGVFLVIHLAWIVYVALGHWPVVNSPAALVAFYTVAATRPHRTTAVCAVLMGGVWVCAGLISDSDAMAAVVGQAVGYPLVLWRFGYHARRSAELAVRLRAEQAERARREVAEERVRIARELHDVVAHHMAVINVQAGLARFVFDTDAGTARGALGAIGDASAEALAELRRMLGLLRSDSTPDTEAGAQGGAAEPTPGLDRLEEMVDRVRAGGVPVDLRVRGEPAPLSSGVQLCVYRVVQEALTNVLKHAPGARATVELRYAGGQLTVSVADDGRAAGKDEGKSEGKGEGKGVDSDKMREHVGHGLIGMRERAKLYGGTIVVGPRSEGGFGVRLTLPTSVHAARRGDTVAE
ncbi:sensor histidine kinase [Streptomyces naganishii]|uniref:sensor histidine kinase n=1 Tax=Streptomyces naganishii TaxID=285447 RepID=UPI00167E806A|nr:sensor histidine kinase [Streptomyces naganishii]